MCSYTVRYDPMLLCTNDGHASLSPRLDNPYLLTIIFLITCSLFNAIYRLILGPIIMIPLVLLLVKIGVLPAEKKLVQVLICISSASGTSPIVVSCLNQLGANRIASQLAYMLTFQYMASVITVTIWATVSVAIIYG